MQNLMADLYSSLWRAEVSTNPYDVSAANQYGAILHHRTRDGVDGAAFCRGLREDGNSAQANPYCVTVGIRAGGVILQEIPRNFVISEGNVTSWREIAARW